MARALNLTGGAHARTTLLLCMGCCGLCLVLVVNPSYCWAAGASQSTALGDLIKVKYETACPEKELLAKSVRRRAASALLPPVRAAQHPRDHLCLFRVYGGNCHGPRLSFVTMRPAASNMSAEVTG